MTIVAKPLTVLRTAGPDRKQGGEKERLGMANLIEITYVERGLFPSCREGNRISRATGTLQACCCHRQRSFHRVVNLVRLYESATGQNSLDFSHS